MLTQLSIKQFAIITSLEMQFHAGMTVITGETGAGKSIMFDALSLCLGARGDQSCIRQQAERAEIAAEFDLSQRPDIVAWLREQELDDDTHCIIRRTLSRDGRSRCYINGSPVSLRSIKSLAPRLINICGQHEHHTLQKPEGQLQRLDLYAHNQTHLQAIAQSYQQWRELQTQINQQQSLTAEQAQIDLLRYQIDELEALELPDAEAINQLEKHFKQLNNTDSTRDAFQQVLSLCDDEQGLLAQLHQAQQLLAAVSDQAPQVNSSLECLQNALIQIQEVQSDISHQSEQLENDPEMLQQVSKRLDKLHDIARKHKVAMHDLPAHLDKLRQQCQALAEREHTLAALQQQADAITAEYLKAAKKLSKSRQTAAKKLCEKISHYLQQLGMPHGKFSIDFQRCEDNTPNCRGLETPIFLFSANPDQALQPLTKIASGGELARIALAIQVVTAQTDPVSTLLFDEVDVGIGGGTAETVGVLMKQLASAAQVMCVTHQAQVAACASNHYRVEKSLVAEQTQTQVVALSKQQRVEELARMIGGRTLTNKTRTHAKEMLQTLCN